MAAGLRVRVVRAKCCGYTLCAEICPEVYKVDDGGFAYVDDEVVPPALEQAAREAASSCPEGAIVVDEPGSGAGAPILEPPGH